MIDQNEFFPIASPCIGVCTANNRGYCIGCLRSRSERQAWHSLNNLQKRHILKLCYLRKIKLMQQKQQQQEAERAKAPMMKQLTIDDVLAKSQPKQYEFDFS